MRDRRARGRLDFTAYAARAAAFKMRYFPRAERPFYVLDVPPEVAPVVADMGWTEYVAAGRKFFKTYDEAVAVETMALAGVPAKTVRV